MLNLSKIIAAGLVIVALLVGGYAFVLGNKPPAPVAQPSKAESAEAKVQQYPVVVTQRPVAAGQAIEANDLRVALLSINPTGAYQQTTDLVGQVPTIALAPDTPVLAQHLSTGMALQIQPGERAIAIKVDEVSGVGSLVKPGDYVDVFFALRRDNGEVSDSQARMLVSKKRVLAFGSLSLDGPASPEGKKSQSALTPRVESARTAVLAVQVDEVNPLLLAENHGRLSLALRHPADLAVPTPDLFPKWPTVLQALATGADGSKPGDSSIPSLQGVDFATAGLAMEPLAKGHSTKPRPSPVRKASSRTARPSAQPTTIEVILGNEVASVQLP
jgi:pilus assembly protein CpaB